MEELLTFACQEEHAYVSSAWLLVNIITSQQNLKNYILYIAK